MLLNRLAILLSAVYFSAVGCNESNSIPTRYNGKPVTHTTKAKAGENAAVTPEDAAKAASRGGSSSAEGLSDDWKPSLVFRSSDPLQTIYETSGQAGEFHSILTAGGVVHWNSKKSEGQVHAGRVFVSSLSENGRFALLGSPKERSEYKLINLVESKTFDFNFDKATAPRNVLFRTSDDAKFAYVYYELASAKAQEAAPSGAAAAPMTTVHLDLVGLSDGSRGGMKAFPKKSATENRYLMDRILWLSSSKLLLPKSANTWGVLDFESKKMTGSDEALPYAMGDALISTEEIVWYQANWIKSPVIVYDLKSSKIVFSRAIAEGEVGSGAQEPTDTSDDGQGDGEGDGEGDGDDDGDGDADDDNADTEGKQKPDPKQPSAAPAKPSTPSGPGDPAAEVARMEFLIAHLKTSAKFRYLVLTPQHSLLGLPEPVAYHTATKRLAIASPRLESLYLVDTDQSIHEVPLRVDEQTVNHAISMEFDALGANLIFQTPNRRGVGHLQMGPVMHMPLTTLDQTGLLDPGIPTTEPTYHFEFNPNGPYCFASADKLIVRRLTPSQTMKEIDLKELAKKQTMPNGVLPGSILHTVFSKDGRYLAYALQGSTVAVVLDLQTQKSKEFTHAGLGGGRNPFAFSNDSKLLLMIDKDQRLQIHDLAKL